MALPARKPLAVMIALGNKKPEGHDEPDGDEGGSSPASDDEIVACQDMLDAFKADDAEALSTALSHWMDMYHSKGGGEPEGDEEAE